MPDFIGIQPRDVFVQVEFSIDEIRKLSVLMDLISINFDGKDKEETDAKEYFLNKFYPFFKELDKELRNAPNAE